MDVLLGSLKSKTAWFALGLAILGFLQSQTDLVTAVIGEGHIGVFMSVIGGIVYVLRLVTGTPLAQK